MDLIERCILILLSTKPPEKTVELSHIKEKIQRDCSSQIHLLESALNNLMQGGYIENFNGRYKITRKGREYAITLVDDPELNLSYRRIVLARWYYSHVEDLILPFLRGRPISLVKIFTDPQNPFASVKPIFVRYSKRTKKQHIFINSSRDFWRQISAHAIDFIPYVHALPNQQYPDWFVIDLDAGNKLLEMNFGFDLLKEVVLVTYNVLREEFDLNPKIKFSGHRGFQIWVAFDRPIGSFESYRKGVRLVQKLVERELRLNKDFLIEKYGSNLEFPITTSDLNADRESKILFDWSCMKREGDVRAPWSIHWKTGLVSVPLDPRRIKEFSLSQAEPRYVVEHLALLKNKFDLFPSQSALFRKAIHPSLDLFFG